MLRELLAVGVGAVAGYVVGVKMGFRTAVVDYVEDNAQLLEQGADKIYSAQPPQSDKSQKELQEKFNELAEQLPDKDDSDNSNESSGRGFQ